MLYRTLRKISFWQNRHVSKFIACHLNWQGQVCIQFEKASNSSVGVKPYGIGLPPGRTMVMAQPSRGQGRRGRAPQAPAGGQSRQGEPDATRMSWQNPSGLCFQGLVQGCANVNKFEDKKDTEHFLSPDTPPSWLHSRAWQCFKMWSRSTCIYYWEGERGGRGRIVLCKEQLLWLNQQQAVADCTAKQWTAGVFHEIRPRLLSLPGAPSLLITTAPRFPPSIVLCIAILPTCAAMFI